MFEREIKFIYDFNLNKVNRLGPYFTFEQLSGSEVHPAILHYISAEIDYLIYEDRQKLLKNSLFDYSGEKISFYFNQISEEVKRSKRFSQEYIAKLILHASSFTINYLVRPKWALTRFVFDEDNLKSTNDIKQILNYVYYYKYVNKILISYINSKKILSMNAQEFEELLNKADKLGVDAYLSSILGNAVKSMAEFFNIGELQKSKIPLAAVEMYLEEKELFKHLKKVTEVFGNEEGAKFNLQDYQKVFDAIILEKEVVVSEPEETEEYETAEVDEGNVVIEEEIKIQNELAEETPEEEEEQKLPTWMEETEVDDETGEIIAEDEEHEEVPEDEENNWESKEPIEDQVKEEPEEIDEIIEDDEDEVDLNFGGKIADAEEQAEVDDEEIEIDGFRDNSTDEAEEEIIIAPPVRLRINVNDDNRIEPLTNQPEEESERQSVEMDESGPSDEEEFDDESEELIADLGEDEEGDSEESEEEQIEESDKHEIKFQDEFNLAQTEFEGMSDDDKSFLQTLRDQKKMSDQDEEKDNSGSDASMEQQRSSQKRSEWPVYIKGEDEPLSPEKGYEGKEQKPTMDLAELLEHKDMTKIIETIFDYDFEDFANTLDEISNCKNEDDAQIVINETLINRHISRTSKEAESFRSIISEYFNTK